MQIERRTTVTRVYLFALLAMSGGIAGVGGGCSMDGGFFPGSITHDEGAVDYRVAEMLDVDRVPGTDGNTDVSNFQSYLPLGGPKNQPYIPFSKDIEIGSFAKIKKPTELARAESRVFETQQILGEANAKAVTQTAVEAKANAVRGTADTALRAATKSVEDAKAEVTKYQKEVEQYETELRDKSAIPDDGHSEDENRLKKARIKELSDTVIPNAKKRLGTAESIKATADTRAVDPQTQFDDAEKAWKIADEKLKEAKLQQKIALENFNKAESDVKTLTSAWNAPTDPTTAEAETVRSVRVTLKQAYLREFSENGPVGEVAVLMTVKESRNGLGQQEPKAGRVVYYSEGVRQNAFMNFRDQPVYGPIRYSGDDLQIRISIIELDENDNAVAGAMLKTIASIGSIAYPPSSPVLAALDQIGASLLTLNGPDLEWDYLMRLSAHPPEGMQNTNLRSMYDAWLRDGYFVLLRSDVSADAFARRRVSQSEWSKLYIDPQSGTLYERTDFSERGTEISQVLSAARAEYKAACERFNAASTPPKVATDSSIKVIAAANAAASDPASAERARQEEISAARQSVNDALRKLNKAEAEAIAYSPFKLYTEHSYLVFAVQTGFDSSQLDLAQETAELSSVVEAYSSGSDRLGAATGVLADSLRTSIQQLQKSKEERRSKDNGN